MTTKVIDSVKNIVEISQLKTKIVRAKSPLRISFGGGGTDVPPYPEERGGCVLSCTIDKYSYCTLVMREDEKLNIRSLDYNTAVSYDLNNDLRFDGNLDLIKAAFKIMNIKQGMDVFLHSDVPPGAGLGASSSMTVALVGALSHLSGMYLSGYDIAELAYHIERKELGISGGRQDQYAATFGNFNFIEFLDHQTVVNALKINNDILNEFQYRLILSQIMHKL